MEPGPHASCLSALSISLPVGGQRRGYDNRAYGQQYWGQSGNRGVSAALLLLLPLGCEAIPIDVGEQRGLGCFLRALGFCPLNMFIWKNLTRDKNLPCLQCRDEIFLVQ